jgi:predicted ATPase
MNPMLSPAMSAAEGLPAEPGAARWRLQLLGGFRLADAAGQPLAVAGRSAMLLLARLACASTRSHPREELVELLWPGVSAEAGRNRLRQTLWVLRSVLEAPGLDAMPVLVSDRLSLRLAAGSVDCDVGRFERLVARRQYAAAAALYAGELLPGFYDEWVADERLRLAALRDRCTTADAADAAHAAPPATARPVPPPVPAGAQPSLPAYVSRPFGIDAQAAELGAWVQAQRLVTLTGAGGAGKTRLAVELAQALAAARRFELLRFVPLLGCQGADDMADAMALALHGRPGARDDPLAPVVGALAGQHSLLVLDNFEPLPEAATRALEVLLARLPRLHLLVTSRRRLGLDGECEFRIRPLPLPAPASTLAEAAVNPAVALFVDRARAARDSFRLNDRNLGVLCELVHALEGAPLAIELAAARVRSHPLPQMLQVLQGASPPGGSPTPVLDLLRRGTVHAGGAGGRRHDSLRTLIEWSWQQLSPEQATLLADLSLFTHSCPLEAAAAVAGLGVDEARHRLDALQAHSLLNLLEDEAGSWRVALNAAVREFASQQLDAARLPRLRAGLRRWLRAWGDAMPATPSLPAMRAEMPHLQTALAGAATDHAGDEAVHIVLALRAALSAVSVPRQVVDAFEAALEACADRALRCRGRVMLVVLRYELGEPQAARRLADLALAEVPEGDGALRARALHRHAYIHWLSTRDSQALGAALDEALGLAREHGQLDTEAGVLALQAYIAGAVHRDRARNEALHRQVLALYQRLGNAHLVNTGLYNLAICAFKRRAFDEALQRLEGVSQACAALGDTEFVARASHVRGNTLAESRRWAEAAQAHREAVRGAHAGAHGEPLAHGLLDLPRALAHLRQAAPAARLAGFAQAHWLATQGELGAAERRKLRGLRRLLRPQLGPAHWDLCQAQGAAMGLAEAVELALSESGG